MGKARIPKNSSFLVVSLVVVRLISALYNFISDCDETYNYWEVSHYLIYGNGYVTWEYSPIYALRSYFYLWIYSWPPFILSFIVSNETALFYFVRVTIAAFSVFSELYFCIGLRKNAGNDVAKYCLSFLVISSGTYFASTAFLPNTFSMHLTMLTFGAWFCDHYKLTIFVSGVSVLIGWPYAVLAYTPIAICLLYSRRSRLYFIMFSLVYGVMILVSKTTRLYIKLTDPHSNSMLSNSFHWR